MHTSPVSIFLLQNYSKTISQVSIPSGIGLGVRNANRTDQVGIGAKLYIDATMGKKLKHARSGIPQLVGRTLCQWCERAAPHSNATAFEHRFAEMRSEMFFCTRGRI